MWDLDTVHCLDWRDLLAGVDDCSVDAIVTDPPYNTTDLDFEQAIDWLAFWSESKRVLSSPQSPVIMFSQQPFTTDLIVSNRKWFRYEIIWEKTMPMGFVNASSRPMKYHENILVFSQREATYYPQMEQSTAEPIGRTRRNSGKSAHYGVERKASKETGMRYPSSIWKFAQKQTFDGSDILHPTQKPLPLMERLLLTYTQRGDVVLDCFCGSGTTLRAAQVLGRHYIGGDSGTDERTGKTWATIANERLAKNYTISMFTD